MIIQTVFYTQAQRFVTGALQLYPDHTENLLRSFWMRSWGEIKSGCFSQNIIKLPLAGDRNGLFLRRGQRCSYTRGPDRSGHKCWDDQRRGSSFCSLYVAMHHCRPPFDLHSGQIIVTSGALNCNTIINAAQSNSYNN